MDSLVREILEEQIKKLEAEREPVAEELDRIDSELKTCRASLAPWIAPLRESPPKEAWVAVHEALKDHRSHMQKKAIINKLKPLGYRAQIVGQSIETCVRPKASDAIRLTRSGQGKKIDNEEWIGLPEWGPYKPDIV
jgi:hypothetical protein